MKKSGIKFSLAVLSVLVLTFSCGCRTFKIGVSTEPESLKVLTPEDIESIFAEISYETTEKYPSETDENGSLIVFWLEGGAVWHVSQYCSTVNKSDPEKVKNGSVQEAIDSGKERPCRICGKNIDYTPITEPESGVSYTDTDLQPETEKNPKEYSEDGELIVFWLDGGKVWHESRYCSSLSRTDPEKIKQGSAAEALAAGKERVCKNCSD